MSSDYQLDAEQMSKLLHDINAPMTTTVAFKSELMESIDDLSALVDSLESELSSQSHSKIQDIINQDLKVCATHMTTSVDTLHSRIKQFVKEFSPIVD